MVFPLLGAIGGFLGKAGAAAVLGAGTQLLGGYMQNRAARKAQAAQNAYNDPMNIRLRAEAAGFNPLLFVGPGVGLQNAPAPSGYMGAALADAGMLLADGLAKSKSLGRLERAERLNAKLTQRVNDLTLRPPVPGVYARASGGVGYASSDRSDRGSVVGGGVSDAAGALPPDGGLAPYLVDVRRDREVMPITDDGGFAIIDNPNLGRPFPVPAFNGEILDLGQGITLAGFYWLDKQRQKYGATVGPPRDDQPFIDAARRRRADVSLSPPEYKTVMRNGRRVRVLKSPWDK